MTIVQRLASAVVAPALALMISGCGNNPSGTGGPSGNQVSQDPFGATGAPGSDLTDNGVTDGASGLADNGQAEAPLNNGPVPGDPR